jgi:hypothetical protein
LTPSRSLRLKHFLRPARSLRVIGQRLAQRSEVRRLIQVGRQRFEKDPRYHVQYVEEGFEPRPSNAGDDAVLLQRICNAYTKAMERQRSVSEKFQANQWWRLVQGANLGTVMRALSLHDVDSLRAMYGNFFRDPCGAGLVGLRGIQNGLNGYKELFLIDALHRMDLWKRMTAARFPLMSLRTPDIGNPFGIMMGDLLVRTGSEDQHFYAQKISSLADPEETPVVAEVGGGFGGMAYYLIRDCARVKYLDFDVPESIALASWYLLKAFPGLTATLYGEADLNTETLNKSDIILMPAFELPRMPDLSVDVSFNSHVLSDMPAGFIHEYLAEIVRTTRGCILHINRSQSCRIVSDYLARNAPEFALLGKHEVTWNCARAMKPDEWECLYSRSQ